MNFDGYVENVEADPLKPVIMNEYQATQLHTDGNSRDRRSAPRYLKDWLAGDKSWLTVLGDYGVGKSWMLKKFLYDLIEEYKSDPLQYPLPLFVPLQQFNKTFDFETLITTTLQNAGVTTVNYKAFEYLASIGKVVFLLDSFDEMAQNIRPNVIRENLAALLIGVANGSKAVLTSRPTYFESRAERLVVVEKDGSLVWEPLDRAENERRTQIAELIGKRLSTTSYARLTDLSRPQRLALFKRVLAGKPDALRELEELHKRFESLEGVSQRAVIARLLTTVAETLADSSVNKTADGYQLLSEDVKQLNEAKVFEIVVTNLLYRDLNFGGLSAGDRHGFLRSFAVRLQQPGRSVFAVPEEVKELVKAVFSNVLAKSDTPSADLENYYRTCRRHSGLTTERQFADTSGAIDSPVDERDLDSPVGYSHNSLREFLVADAIADHLLCGSSYDGLHSAQITETVSSFFAGLADYNEHLSSRLRELFLSTTQGSLRQWLFKLLYGFVRKNRGLISLMGIPAALQDLDLAGADLSGLELSGSNFTGSLLLETDFRKSDLNSASFSGAVLERAQFDGANLRTADFRDAEVISIYVHDKFQRGTTAVLDGKDALQWMYSSGAVVSNDELLNPYLGRMWYDAAREVAASLSSRLAGTHRKRGLIRGTRMAQRAFAIQFTDYLLKRNIIAVVRKNRSGGDVVVQVQPGHRSTVSEFAESGTISADLQPFFAAFLEKQ